MLRLSQRAWNNVIIVTMLVMILLFTSTTKILNGEAPEVHVESALLPLQSTILTIDFGQQKIERIGRGWRLKSGNNVDESALQQLIENWLNTGLELIDVQVPEQPLIVIVWLAGESQGMEYKFFQLEDRLLVSFAQQLYQVQDRSLADLFPQGAY
jgi:hypothetical protein